jgi:hypothetical protein
MRISSRTTVRTSVAAVFAMGALSGCGGGSSSISDQAHRDFVAGCTKSGPPHALCECIFARLTGKEGYNSEAKLKALAAGGTYLTVVQRRDRLQALTLIQDASRREARCEPRARARRCR